MFSLTKARLENLKARGYLTQNCIDIGSNIGDWTLMFNKVFPSANVLAIEANPLCERSLKERNINYKISLLGDSECERHFYVEKGDFLSGGASIYLENTSYYDDYYIIKLPMKTLDALEQQFDFIKIDVQGAELDVLNGGKKTMALADFILLELSVVNYNEGSPKINEAIQYMQSNGFIIYDIFDLHYDTFYKLNSRLLQIDICFINKKLEAEFINKW